MSQTLNLKAKGLHTHPNPLGDDIPLGALLVADNVIIDKEGTTAIRRGFKTYGTAITLTGSNKINKIYEYADKLIISHATSLSYDADGAGTWTAYSGSYSPPSGAIRMRTVGANKNLYLATSTGVKKLDSLTGTPGSAGGPKALNGTGATSGVSGFMSTNTQVAYRVVFGITDANSNKILGAPSQRLIVPNTSGGSRDVALTFYLPSGMTTSHFYQVYRSGQSTSSTEEPNDELQLVVEKKLTSTDISNGYFTYTDSTPDTLRGATIYTATSQQGILQANEPPPLCTDMTLYKNMVLFSNTTSKHRLYITLISVGGSGVVNDDTITIAGTVYTGKGSENAAAGEFLVSTGGSASQNIDTTARSLVKVINTYATNTLVYAYYISGYADLPGQILVEERTLGGNAFVAISSRGTAFSPEIPSAGSTYTSTNEVAPNRIYVSKPAQPEAVPILNYIDVGAAQKDILRIIALRDSVFVLKEDGIFRITGETFADLRVALFDSTTICQAIESAVSFNNQVVCFTTQGVVAISDSGVAILSRPIEFTLLTLSSSQYTNFAAATFGISYESDRKYILCTVSAVADTYATQQFVYNSVTTTWTRWNLSISCGHVFTGDNKLYLGSADSSYKYVRQERKAYTITDYADYELAVTVTSSTGTTVNLSSTTGIAAGDSLAQFNADGTLVRNSIIVSVDSATAITVTDTESWAAGAGKVYTAIPVSVTYAPVHGGNPAVVKHFTDLIALFSNADFDEINFSFTSDMSISVDDVDLTPLSAGAWGLFEWGMGAWGGGAPAVQPLRTLIPLEKARCNWLNISMSISQALTSFALSGISLFADTMSQRRR